MSGFFGIAGFLHVARFFFRVPVRIGTYDVPLSVGVGVGVAFIGISAGLLWLEVQRERAKRRSAEETKA